jgi:hypothetical protein
MSEVNPELDSIDEGQSQQKADDVNTRLLEESKKNKAKLQAANAKLAELEGFRSQKLEEEGQYKKLLEQANEKLKLKDEESKSLKQKTLKGNIVSTISRFANDVVDLDDLLNQPKFKSIIEDGLDEDSLSLTDEAAQAYVKAVLEAKPHLKKPSSAIQTHKGGKPNYVPKEAAKTDISAMSRDELEKHILSLSEKGLLK